METTNIEMSPAVRRERDGTRRLGPWRREVGAFLELFALSGIAVAQPTLDIFQNNADYLLSRHTSVREAVAFALVFALVPAVVLWVVEVLLGAVVPRARRWAHAAIAAALIGVFAVEVAKQLTDLGPDVLLAFGALLGVLGGVALLRVPAVHNWLRYLSPAPVAFAAIFIFASPVSAVIFVNDPAPADVAIGNPHRVVMVVFDELPLESLLDGSGRVDPVLFPNFARLAGDANWYRNTTTVAPNTTAAVPAILTGKYPAAPEPVPTASELPQNLFTLLGSTYAMNVHESATRLCPAALCPLPTTGPRANDGFASLVGEGARQWSRFASPDRTAKDAALLQEDLRSQHAMDDARVFIRSLHPADTPRLDVLHALLPHSPWHYLGAGQDYVETASLGRREGVWTDPAAVSLGRERHLLQLSAADWMLGRAIARLKRLGAYDDSLIVVTADHGVAFRPHGPSRGVSAGNYPEVMWTPLFIKRPHQMHGIVDDRPARSIDVLPTIADVLNVRLPWKVDGRSLLERPRTDGPRRLASWYVNRVQPADGQDFVELNGPEGFAAVVRGRATGAVGDPRLRLYRVGEFGALVGTPVASLETLGGTPHPATLANAGAYERVDPDARRIPWAYVHGTVAIGPNRWIAVVVNDRVAAVGMTSTQRANGQSKFAAILPPQLMTRGANTIQLFVVAGTPGAPRLEPTNLSRA